MATTTELSSESLHDALRAILARGEYPSMAKVRVELGTTASQQTLTRHMKAAWQGLADQMGSGLPEGLPRVVVDAAHRFYEEARGYANAELERQKADMQERENALKSELEQARARISMLDEQVGHRQQRSEAAEAEGQRLGEALDDSQQAYSAAEQRARKLDEQLSDERARAAEQRKQLVAEHERQLAASEKERARCQAGWDREIERSDSQQKAWAKQVDDARQELRTVQSKHDAAEKQLRDALSASDGALQRANEREGVLKAEIQRLSAECATTRQERDEARREASEERKEHKTQVRSIEADLASSRQEQSSLQQSLHEARAIAEERQQHLAALQLLIPKKSTD